MPTKKAKTDKSDKSRQKSGGDSKKATRSSGRKSEKQSNKKS